MRRRVPKQTASGHDYVTTVQNDLTLLYDRKVIIQWWWLAQQVRQTVTPPNTHNRALLVRMRHDGLWI